MKTCRMCKAQKPPTEFYADPHYADGRKADCRPCYTKANYERMSRNRESLNRQKRAWEALNPDCVRAYQKRWRDANPGKAYQRFKEWAASNRPKINATNAKRRAAKRNAMPVWASEEKIAEIYRLRPNGFDVDHIVPLVSDIVCGLHCEFNLQYLPSKENTSKHNRYWPDMPEQRMFA